MGRWGVEVWGGEEHRGVRKVGSLGSWERGGRAVSGLKVWGRGGGGDRQREQPAGDLTASCPPSLCLGHPTSLCPPPGGSDRWEF